MIGSPRRTTRAAALLFLVVLPAGLLADPPSFTLNAARSVSGFDLSVSAPTAPGPPSPACAPFLFAGGTPASPDPATASQGKGELSLRTMSQDFVNDAGAVWGYPFHIRTDDVPFIVGFAATSAVIIAYDEPIAAGFKDYYDSHQWVRDASPVVTVMGGWGAWATAGIFLGAGLIGGEHKATETGVLAAEAMLESSLLVWFLKGMTGRQRPSYASGVDHWSGPAGFFKRYEQGFEGVYDSFPSGHAITAFSLATVVAMEFKETVWVPILSYAVATGVGLSRVTMSHHWLSDAAVGGVLGHVIGRLVVGNHRRRHHAVPALSVSPRSISLALRF